MKKTIDTIVAQATPIGRGGVGVIRVSGPQASAAATALLGEIPKPRYATYKAFRDEIGEPIDRGIALYFPAPHSFTGEDVLELQGHGGPMIMDCLLQRILLIDGVRLARPGEFSERAFLNDKLDLVQAEAIADLIDAGSHQAARAAMRSLQGEFSQAIHILQEKLTYIRMYVEASIDFPEEEVDFLSDERIHKTLNEVLQQLEMILVSAQQGVILREGITVVIAGEPNVGKSSLLNRLSGDERAIVTDIPGTTRDILREYIQLDGIPLHIIDTAGLRHTSDRVEQEGIRRAWAEIEKADRILLVTDKLPINQALPEIPVTIILNKIDLTQQEPAVAEYEGQTIISLSAKTGEGMDLLRQHLKACVGAGNLNEGSFLARRRHVDALQRAEQVLLEAKQQSAGELLAEDLRQAQLMLSEITGEFSADDLLGKIFSSFCIGK